MQTAVLQRGTCPTGLQRRLGASRSINPSASTPSSLVKPRSAVVTHAKRKATRSVPEGPEETKGPDELSNDKKDEVWNATLKDIQAKFGKGALMQLGQQPRLVETLSSGCLTLDVALGGGWPKGRLIEIYGPESSGKTTLALHALAEAQKKGGRVALIDAEHAFDPDYAKSLGLNTDQLWLCQPDCGEAALDIADRMAKSGTVEIIAVDSVAALTPRAEIDGDVGNMQIGSQARLMSHALRKLAASTSKMGCTIIFLNQIRYKIGVMYGSPETTSGGNALKFYASVRVDVRKRGTIPEGKNEVVEGIKVEAKVIKNKCAPPYRRAAFDIMFGSGINSLGCVLDAADACGVIRRAGSYYYFGEEKLGQGRDKALDTLIESPELAQRVEEATRQALKSTAIPDVGGDDKEFADLDVEPEAGYD